MTTLQDVLLSAIEIELQHQISRLATPRLQPLHDMLTYHMGWTGDGSGRSTQGKRIRPLLLLLICAACGGDWNAVLPAAASVELVHNFSLIHDDIQDNSAKRRGRDTVWFKWGMPQGINAGDALFVIANSALLDLVHSFDAELIFSATTILQAACLNLTEGQFLDISYEKRVDLTMEDYWTMATGKTAALLSACCAIGSLLGGGDETIRDAYRNYGHFLGLAFQVQDDYLGIWGDSALTGKSIASDLVTGKNSLPVLFGLEKKGAFAKRWLNGSISADEVRGLSDQLETEGARLFTQNTADQLTDMALQYLRSAEPVGDFGQELFELTNRLMGRQG
jgi:geranylgeranyl diphosphate synthase type I